MTWPDGELEPHPGCSHGDGRHWVYAPDGRRRCQTCGGVQRPGLAYGGYVFLLVTLEQFTAHERIFTWNRLPVLTTADGQPLGPEARPMTDVVRFPVEHHELDMLRAYLEPRGLLLGQLPDDVAGSVPMFILSPDEQTAQRLAAAAAQALEEVLASPTDDDIAAVVAAWGAGGVPDPATLTRLGDPPSTETLARLGRALWEHVARSAEGRGAWSTDSRGPLESIRAFRQAHYPPAAPPG